MSVWWRVQTAVAAAGIAAAGAVLTWSLLGLNPVLSPQGVSVLWGVAGFIWLVAILAFHVPLLAGHVPDDQFASSSIPTVNWTGQRAIWSRASFLEAAAAIAALPGMWLIFLPAIASDPGSPAQVQFSAAFAALVCISAVALSVIGSRPVDVERFGHPHQRRPPAPN